MLLGNSGSERYGHGLNRTPTSVHTRLTSEAARCIFSHPTTACAVAPSHYEMFRSRKNIEWTALIKDNQLLLNQGRLEHLNAVCWVSLVTNIHIQFALFASPRPRIHYKPL